MCTTCGHYNSSKAACSQCGLRGSWADVVKGVQQTNSTTLPSQPKEEIKVLEAALAALPGNVDLFGKVRAPLEERLQHASKEARESKPLDQRHEGYRGALQRASNKLRVLRNRQHKRHSRKPMRTSLVFEQNLTSLRNRHSDKPPSQLACRPSLAKRLHLALR